MYEFDSNLPEPMIFRPTIEEFSDLQKFVSSIEAQGAQAAGICKIITPTEYQPRKVGYEPEGFSFMIEKPLKQVYTPIQGMEEAFTTACNPQEGMLVGEYKEMTQTPLFATPPHESHQHLEQIFWKEMKENKVSPLYGADVMKSLMDEDMAIWNFQNLKTILTEGMENNGIVVYGVNTPYLYFGAWRTTFSWHVEDMDLYGVNYMHHGAPKTWYCLPSKSGYKIEQLARDLLPDQALCCTNFLRHKTVMMSPQLLMHHGIEVSKVIQTPGDIIMVFPHAYHAGFNHGYNIAEATNIALPRWVEYGKRYRGCDCADAKLSVNLDMTYFIEKYQPDQYKMWLEGKDIGPHPDDHIHVKNFFKAVMTSANPKTFLAMLDKNTIPMEFIHTYYKMTGENCLSNGYTDEFSESKNGTDSDQNNDEDWKPITKRIPKKRRKNNMMIKQIYKKRLSFPDKCPSKGMKNGCEKIHCYMPCGECDGCMSRSCGDCWICRDTPRYGGSGVARQRCEFRVCSRRVKVKCSHCKW